MLYDCQSMTERFEDWMISTLLAEEEMVDLPPLTTPPCGRDQLVAAKK